MLLATNVPRLSWVWVVTGGLVVVIRINYFKSTNSFKWHRKFISVFGNRKMYTVGEISWTSLSYIADVEPSLNSDRGPDHLLLVYNSLKLWDHIQVVCTNSSVTRIGVCIPFQSSSEHNFLF